MTGTNRTRSDSVTSALEAVVNPVVQDLRKIYSNGQVAALVAHSVVAQARLRGFAVAL